MGFEYLIKMIISQHYNMILFSGSPDAKF